MSSGRKISYWLIPSEHYRKALQQTISELSHKFDAPIFEPHVTLYVGDASDEEARDLIGRVTVGKERIYLRVTGLGHTTEFTKTLFIEFEESEAITDMYGLLRDNSNSPSTYLLKPHLSLIYSRIDRNTRKTLVKTITLPFSEIRFDSVAAVLTPAHVERNEDVESWETLFSTELRRTRE